MHSQNKKISGKIMISDGKTNLCNTAVIIIIMVRGRIAPERKNIKNIAHNVER